MLVVLCPCAGDNIERTASFPIHVHRTTISRDYVAAEMCLRL